MSAWLSSTNCFVVSQISFAAALSGNPKMPVEIPGIDTDLKLRSIVSLKMPESVKCADLLLMTSTMLAFAVCGSFLSKTGPTAWIT